MRITIFHAPFSVEVFDGHLTPEEITVWAEQKKNEFKVDTAVEVTINTVCFSRENNGIFETPTVYKVIFTETKNRVLEKLTKL